MKVGFRSINFWSLFFLHYILQLICGKLNLVFFYLVNYVFKIYSFKKWFKMFYYFVMIFTIFSFLKPTKLDLGTDFLQLSYKPLENVVYNRNAAINLNLPVLGGSLQSS